MNEFYSFLPLPGEIYRNVNGIDYKCARVLNDKEAEMVQSPGKYIFTAHGIQRNADTGEIRWEYSYNGGFAEGGDPF